MARLDRLGASTSTKQIHRQVIEGRKITFHFTGLPSTEGYVAGMDDFHWMIVTSDGNTRLVHKAGAVLIDLHREATYMSEPEVRSLEEIVGPFRRHILKSEFQKADDPIGDAVAALQREMVPCS